MSNEPEKKFEYGAQWVTGEAWLVKRVEGAERTYKEQLLTTSLTDPDEVIKLAIEINSWA